MHGTPQWPAAVRVSKTGVWFGPPVRQAHILSQSFCVSLVIRGIVRVQALKEALEADGSWPDEFHGHGEVNLPVQRPEAIYRQITERAPH